MVRSKFTIFFTMYKKLFLIGVCIIGYYLSAYSQNNNGGVIKVSTDPVQFDELVKLLDLEPSDPLIDVQDIAISNFDSVGTIINDFGTKVYSLEAQYIGAKLKYNGLVTEKKNVPLKIKIITGDGSILAGADSPEGFSFTEYSTVAPGNNYLIIPGFGNNTRKTYKPGEYTYEVWSGSKKLVSKQFTIYPQKPELYSSAYLKINAIRFINTDAEGRDITGEGGALYSHKMRYLSEIITYEGLCSKEQKISYNIRIFKPNGLLWNDRNSSIGYTYTTVMTVCPGHNKSLMQSRWGSKSESIYEKGTYIFEIWENDKKIYETTFNVK